MYMEIHACIYIYNMYNMYNIYIYIYVYDLSHIVLGLSGWVGDSGLLLRNLN